jgi:hypothetical protein
MPAAANPPKGDFFQREAAPFMASNASEADATSALDAPWTRLLPVHQFSTTMLGFAEEDAAAPVPTAAPTPMAGSLEG